MFKYAIAALLLFQTTAHAETAAEKLFKTEEKTFYREITIICAHPGEAANGIFSADSIDKISDLLNSERFIASCPFLIQAERSDRLFKEPIDPPDPVLDSNVKQITGLSTSKEKCVARGQKILAAMASIPMPTTVPPGFTVPSLSTLVICYPEKLKVLNEKSQQLFSGADKDA